MDKDLEELVNSLKPGFALMDTNNDGKLTKEEIKAFAKSYEADVLDEKCAEVIETCNPGGKDVTFEQATEKGPDLLMKMLLFVKMDTNNDKHINLDEFKTMTEAVAGPIGKTDELMKLFNQMDKNGDGLITLSELLDFTD